MNWLHRIVLLFTWNRRVRELTDLWKELKRTRGELYAVMSYPEGDEQIEMIEKATLQSVLENHISIYQQGDRIIKQLSKGNS